MNQHVAEIVAGYVRKNRLNAAELPQLIKLVSQAMAGLGQGVLAPTPLTPAVPIRRSVAAASVTCLDCGFKAQMLKRHLRIAHGFTPADYRARWDLPRDYPLVAKNYSARRSEVAKASGLGRMRPGPAPGQ